MRFLMVCLGNICRSPLAEGIMQSKIDQRNLSWQVDSVGTSGWHAGQKPDARSIEVAHVNGIDISRQKSRKINVEELANFDLILVMDQSNYNDVVRLAPSQESKVKKILDYGNMKRSDVPDPYYDGGFDLTYLLLDNACEGLVESLVVA